MHTGILADFAAFQRAQGLAETTIRNRHSIVLGLSRHTGKRLVDITIADLRNQLGRTGISPATRRTERAAFVAFYRFAVEDKHVQEDPTVKLPTIRAPKGEPRPFTREQIDAMLQSGAYAKTRAMILLGYYQGFRVSSIARVHGSDIDHLSQSIRTVGKGGKARTLPLHPVIEELAHSMPADDYWFPARGGRSGHVRPSSVTDRITRAKHRAGITNPDLTPHSLRHAFGTDLVDGGVDIRVVKELMMHESLATTQIYTAVSASRKREGIAALAPRDVPARSGRSMSGGLEHETIAA